MEAKTKTSTCIYHFLAFNWYMFLSYYIPNIGKDEEKLKFFHDGGRAKFLTLLNLLLQAIFFGVACLDDVLKRVIGRKDVKFITFFRDLLFTTLAFPVSTFVFLVFWVLFLYDRDLIYPKALDGFFPVWTNHAMHTLIFPLSLVEFILRPHRYPSKKLGLTLLGICALTYISRILLRIKLSCVKMESTWPTSQASQLGNSMQATEHGSFPASPGSHGRKELCGSPLLTNIRRGLDHIFPACIQTSKYNLY